MYRKATTLIEVMIVIAIVAILLSLIFGVFKGCNQQNMAKNWGGKMEIVLPPNTKLVNVTWKQAELWYITRPMRKDETPEVYTFHEKSTFGMLEGTIILKESTTSVEK